MELDSILELNLTLLKEVSDNDRDRPNKNY